LYALGTTASVPPSSGGSSSGGSVPVSAAPAAAPAPVSTPRADGSIVHVVTANDSFWTIAIQYASSIGMTPEEALPAIRELNNNPAFINVGQELLIKEPGEVIVEPEPLVDEESSEEEPSEEVIEVEGANSDAPAEEIAEAPVAEAETAPTTGTICVAAFNDINGDGSRDNTTEALQADAAITIFRGGSTVTTHITDGVSEPYCFENLAPDTYQVQIFPPADYQPTTSPSWAVSVAEGAQISVSFGTRFDPQVTAVADTGDTAPEDTAVSPPAEDTAAAPAAEGGFFSSIGGIVLVVAAILVLLAGVGVVMLRRG
jgi:LysM repeat protein